MLIRQKDRDIIQFICILSLTVLLMISFLHLIIFKEEMTFKVAVIFSIISTIVSFVLIFVNKGIDNFGVFTALFIYFTLVHFGASTIFFISPESIYDSFEPHQYVWLNSTEVSLAILICVIAQIVYIFSGLFFARRSKKPIKNVRKRYNERSIWIPRVGFLCVLLVLIYFLYNIAIGQISLTSGYSDYREWRKESEFIVIATFLLATGYVIVIATGNKKQILNINLLYCLIGIILFLTGNKGEVLYAAFAALGIYYSRFKHLSRKVIILFLGLFFIIIPFITAARSGSIIDSVNLIGLNIIDPFLETGWQLRTVEKIVHWINEGENLGYGISYFAPMQRIISSLTLGIIPAIPITGVPWSFGQRLPGWGFSQVAESYYNFSLLGPIIFYFFQGWFSIKVEKQGGSAYKNAWFASIVVTLMILTRNRFSFVPGQIFLALVIIVICFLLDGNFRNGKVKRNF